MTRKDYRLIATEFKGVQEFISKATKDKDYQDGKYDAWYLLAVNLANSLAKANSRFDRKKFLEACGL
jgi:hypothetical protein